MILRWVTDKNLGVVLDGSYIEKQLEVDSTVTDGFNDVPVTFRLLSGSLPIGLDVTDTGLILGTPKVTSIESDSVCTFTIRAETYNGMLADRSFKITVSGVQAPTIVTQTSNLGVYYDGSYFSYQLESSDPQGTDNHIWKLVRGRLPPGVVLNKSGLLEGFLYQNSVDYEALANIGWDKTRWDKYYFDYVAAQSDSDYEFTVELTDGISFSRKTYVLRVIAKDQLTGDFTYLSINDTEITTDNNPQHLPFVTTMPQRLPEIKPELARQGTYFAFKFDGVDFDNDEFKFEITSPDQRGFDQDGDNENHSHGVGFDMDEYDSSDYPMPMYIGLNNETGWYTGQIKEQAEYRKDYVFQVYARKANSQTLRGYKSTFMLTVLGQYDENINWVTDSNLGSIENGSISGFRIEARSTSNRPVYYKLKTDKTSRTPQGTMLTQDGMLSGRVSFEYFEIDKEKTTFDGGKTTFEETFEFTVIAETRTSNRFGSRVVGVVVNKQSLPIGYRGLPADEYITADDRHVHIWNGEVWTDVGPLNSNVQISAYAERTFKLHIRRTNVKPYENLWLRGFPNVSQRLLFKEIMNNQDIFPDQLIYRLNDSWYGKAQDLRFLFLPGVNPLNLENYIQALSKNHYTKTVLFGEVKTAVALDDNFNVAYEVVYLDVIDESEGRYRGTSATTSTTDPIRTQSTTLTTKNAYQYKDETYTEFAPNGLNNMAVQIGNFVGLANKETLPQWMSSPQPDADNPGQYTTPSGYIRAVVLAYTVPGASKLIAYRLKNAKFSFNRIPFSTDRYQLDDYLTKNWDKALDQYIPGKESTFDQKPSQAELLRTVGSVTYAVTVPYEKINNQPVDYIQFYNCIDGDTEFRNGDTVIFAQQERFQDDPASDYRNYDVIGYKGGPSQDLRYWPQPGTKGFQYGADDLFDSDVLDRGLIGFNRWVNDDGTRLPYNKWLYKTDGWLTDLPFDSDTYSELTFSETVKIPGFIDHVLEGKPNERSGIYRINILNNYVTLSLVKQIKPGDIVSVEKGSTYAGRKMYFEAYAQRGNVPRWWTLTQKLYIEPDSGENTIKPHKETTFDSRGTRFFSYRDQYAEPESLAKYIKFPNYGVFR